MKKNKTIVIASHNSGKIKEMAFFLKKISVNILSAKDFNLSEPIENGKTFEENALIKARYVNKKVKKTSIADDSGLVIPILNGKPGIFSARWAGKNKNFDIAMKKLNNLIFKKKVNAYYISALAICWNNRKEKTFTGKIFGEIIWPPRGNLGFGYDPIFIPNSYNKTFGELKIKHKNRISHRAVVFKKFTTYLNK